MPVSFVNGSRFAAIAEVGAVFSEMKFSVVPPNCFHSSPATGLALLDDDPQPPSQRAAPPAPAIRNTSRLEYDIFPLGARPTRSPLSRNGRYGYTF